MVIKNGHLGAAFLPTKANLRSIFTEPTFLVLLAISFLLLVITYNGPGDLPLNVWLLGGDLC